MVDMYQFLIYVHAAAFNAIAMERTECMPMMRGNLECLLST